MSRMTVTIPLPDSRILHDVLRLCDCVDAVRARQPAGPGGYCPADDTIDREPREIADLRDHLRVLPDDHQAQIHAIYWIGRDLKAGADQYAQLHRYALVTDLGDSGAAYLAGKVNLGDGLRCGLQKLGLLNGRMPVRP